MSAKHCPWLKTQTPILPYPKHPFLVANIALLLPVYPSQQSLNLSRLQFVSNNESLKILWNERELANQSDVAQSCNYLNVKESLMNQAEIRLMVPFNSEKETDDQERGVCISPPNKGVVAAAIGKEGKRSQRKATSLCCGLGRGRQEFWLPRLTPPSPLSFVRCLRRQEMSNLPGTYPGGNTSCQ